MDSTEPLMFPSFTTGVPLAPVAVPLAAPTVEAAPQPTGNLRVRSIGARIGRSGVDVTPPEWLVLANDWNRLAGVIPFRRLEWFETWWRHYGRSGWELLVLVIEAADGRPVGLAPWYLAGDRLVGRTLRMLGSGEVCSEYQSVLCEPGHEAQVAAALADWLNSGVGGRWDSLVLSAVAQDDPAVGALADELSRRGYLVHQCCGMPCWRTELAGSWEAFLRGLSSSRRARVRQLTRKYFDTGRVVIRQATSRSSLEEGYRILVEMHQRRRQSLGQAGCFASPRFAGFHAEICRKFHADGVLRLLWTELDGRPVAAEYSFMGGQTVYYYQTGLEPAAYADEPGWLGMIGSLQQAIGAGFHGVDFLRGEESYKTSWGARPQPIVETRVVACRPLAHLRHGAWLARRRLHDFVRHSFLGFRPPRTSQTTALSAPAQRRNDSSLITRS